MNTYGLIHSNFLVVFIWILLEMRNLRNIIVLVNRENEFHQAEPRWTHKYNRTELIEIGQKVNNINMFKRLPYETCAIIRKYKLNRRKRGSRAGKRVKDKKFFRRSSNFSNLVKIKIVDDRKSENISEKTKIMLCNVQSLKSKELLVREHIDETKVDVAILVETWLNQNDDEWCTSSELNNNGLQMDRIDRKNRKGGGIMVVCKQSIQLKRLKKGNKLSFEYGIWRLSFKSITMTIIVIYRPPYSQKHQYTVSAFLDELTDLLTNVLPDYNNIIVLGDINLHWDDDLDPDIGVYRDTMVAMGLRQFVNTPTHKAGHILDHIFVEDGCKLNITDCALGCYISDHSSIICELNIPKENFQRVTKTTRNLKSIDQDVLCRLLECNIADETSVNTKVEKLENIIRIAIDQLAPAKTVTKTIRYQNAWFTDELRYQRRKVRRRERIWKKYKEEHHWSALKVEKNRYIWQLRKSKNVVMTNLILESKRKCETTILCF